MTPFAALLASLLCVSGARAADQIVVGHEPPPLTLEDHLQTGHAWTIMQIGFPDILKAHLKQVAGARPGRLMPGTRFTVLGTPDPEGHFISAACGEPPKACPKKADEMEKRVLAATLLRALPTHKRVEELYDLDTFRLKETGKWAFDLTEEYYPRLWDRLRAMGPGGGKGGAGGAPIDPAQPPAPAAVRLLR